MNWIIRSTKKVKFHTNLQEVLKPIWNDLTGYDWILTDLDYISDQKIPINFNHDYFVLNQEEFQLLYQSNAQIIWGIISAIPKNAELNINLISNLSAEDERAWKSDHFMITESIIEIVAFDSGYTIIKFKNEKLSNIFRDYFQEEALDLQEFTKKHILNKR